MKAKASIVCLVRAALVLCVLWGVAFPAIAGLIQWSGNGHSYEAVYVGADTTWSAARAAAEARGGYLVSITSAAENAFVYSLVTEDKYWGPSSYGGFGPWLGGYQYDKLAEPAGHWAWVSGEPWTYTNWSVTEEPSNSEDQEDYLHFFDRGSSKSSTWNDQYNDPISGQVVAYIVEYDGSPFKLIWDEAGPGNWSQPRWIGDAAVPDDRYDVEVKTDPVSINAVASARSLAVTSGQLIVEPTGDLTVVEDVIVKAAAAIDLSGAITAQSLACGGDLQVAPTGNLSITDDVAVKVGANLELAGTLSAGSLTASGTHAIAPGANLVVTKRLTVDSNLDLTGANLTTNAAVTGVVVNETGSLVLDQTLRGASLSVAGSVQAGGIEVATLSVTGDVQTAGAELNTLDVSDNGLWRTSADAIATNATVNGGSVQLTDGAHLHVVTMQIGPGSSGVAPTVDTGTGCVEIGERLKIGAETSYSISGGTLCVSGANLADPSRPSLLTISGGELTLAGGTIAPGGAIAHWMLDEGSGSLTGDSTLAGNNHAATISGATWVDDPQRGTVLAFDGVGDVVKAANAGDLRLGYPGKSTIAMWINTWQKGGELLGKDNGDGNWFLGEKALAIDDSTGAVTLIGRSGGALTGTTNVADGQWHHIAVTYNGSTSVGEQEVYVDGVNDTASRNYSGMSDTGSLLQLGMADLVPGLAYVGLMDDVYFYDRSLGASEVGDLYANLTGAGDLSNASLWVTADSAVNVESDQDEVSLGDLTLESGVVGTFSGSPVRFQNVSGGDLASVAGNVTVAGALSAGNSPGTLDVVGSLTLDAGSVYVWELGESASDLVAVDGDLTLTDGWTLQLADAGGTCDASEQLDLFTCTGLLSLGQGTIDPSVVQSSGGWDWSSATIAQDGSRVYLTGLTVVPEPSTLVLLAMGACVCLTYVWRRRR